MRVTLQSGWIRKENNKSQSESEVQKEAAEKQWRSDCCSLIQLSFRWWGRRGRRGRKERPAQKGESCSTHRSQWCRSIYRLVMLLMVHVCFWSQDLCMGHVRCEVWKIFCAIRFWKWITELFSAWKSDFLFWKPSKYSVLKIQCQHPGNQGETMNACLNSLNLQPVRLHSTGLVALTLTLDNVSLWSSMSTSANDGESNYSICVR